MEFEAQILKICKIHRKSRIKQSSVLFYKYLANQSSDLHVVVNYYFVNLSLKFHEDLCINACTPVVNSRAHISSRGRAFTTRARAFVHGS